MRQLILALAGAAILSTVAEAAGSDAAKAAIAQSNRSEANVARDEARKPAEVLAFVGLAPGETALDLGAGGGYWSELFAGVVGADGKVYAHYVAGPQFDQNKAAIESQYAPFGNVELVSIPRNDPFPLPDASVDTVMLGYLYHHLHYAEDAGDAMPAATAGILGEIKRVLKPGGEFIVIEHAAAPGSSRAESAAWHRAPAETAKADITGAGFTFAGEADDIYANPDDDLKNVWFDTGLTGKTTSFVHKYKKPK